MTSATAPANLLILWDIDGTLLQPAGGGQNEYELAIETVVPGLALERVYTQGKTDRQIVEEYLTGRDVAPETVWRVLERIDVLSSRFGRESHRIPALDGVDETLARMQALGYTNGLLTGNTPARAMSKLRGSGIDTTLIAWEESFFGTNALVRSDMTVAARRVFPDRPIVIVGDTPRDGEAAAAAGLPFIGVETGMYDRNALTQAGAIASVRDLTGAELDSTLAGIAGS